MYFTNEILSGEKCWMGSSHQTTDSDNPKWMAPSLCIKSLISKVKTKFTELSVLYFPQTMSSLCLVQLSQRKTLTNSNDLTECQNTPATAYVRGSFCFEYWAPLTVRATQA